MECGSGPAKQPKDKPYVRRTDLPHPRRGDETLARKRPYHTKKDARHTSSHLPTMADDRRLAAESEVSMAAGRNIGMVARSERLSPICADGRQRTMKNEIMRSTESVELITGIRVVATGHEGLDDTGHSMQIELPPSGMSGSGELNALGTIKIHIGNYRVGNWKPRVGQDHRGYLMIHPYQVRKSPDGVGTQNVRLGPPGGIVIEVQPVCDERGST